MDRRTFVGMAAAGVVTGCASLVTTTVAPEAGRVRLFLRNHPMLTRPGGFVRLRVAGEDGRLVYVLALDDGTFVAVSPVCKHLGCTVSIDADRLVCPCHGSMYARDGALLRGPAEAPLDRFPMSVADGVLTIDLEGSA